MGAKAAAGRAQRPQLLHLGSVRLTSLQQFQQQHRQSIMRGDSLNLHTLLKKQDRFNLNELLLMLEATETIGPDVSMAGALRIYAEVTCDRVSRMPQVHSTNADCEIHFSEFVEIVVRVGLGAAARHVSIASAPDALLRVGEALHELYDGTERFLNGRLPRPPDPKRVAARAARRSPPRHRP